MVMLKMTGRWALMSLFVLITCFTDSHSLATHLLFLNMPSLSSYSRFVKTSHPFRQPYYKHDKTESFFNDCLKQTSGICDEEFEFLPCSVISAKAYDFTMSDSPVMGSEFSHRDSVGKCSHSGTNCPELEELREGNSTIEVSNPREEVGSLKLCMQRNNTSPGRFQLELDVKRLQKRLQEEMELHAFLKFALEKKATKLSSSFDLPDHIQDLLSNIALLEATVSKLEQETISLHFQLSQERNERRLAEYRYRHSSLESPSLSSTDLMKMPISSLRSSKLFDSEVHHHPRDRTCQVWKDQLPKYASEFLEAPKKNAVDSDVLCHVKNEPAKIDGISCQLAGFNKLSKEMPPDRLWDQPNLLSEEMVRCMKDIFLSLADSALSDKSTMSESHCSPWSPRGHLPNSSWWSSSEHSTHSSWARSPQAATHRNSYVLASEKTSDPYCIRGKLSWADIGNYGLATEISWMSVGKKQLEYAAGALRRFRTLVEQLAKVNPILMNCNEKLAFWINLYNALIMHAYLAYGVPRSDLKLFSLMQKAAYTVSGHSFSAAVIEYVILRMKPPLHRPQTALLLALHKLKVSEEQKKFVIDAYEPQVAFALSCGMYSSPAVRIYAAKNVKEELQGAQRDFIQASVGVSGKGRLLVPKMLHCFAKSYVDDASLAVWISHYLPPDQAAFVEQCISERRPGILGSRNCGILPFDARFRYLFMPDKATLESDHIS